MTRKGLKAIVVAAVLLVSSLPGWAGVSGPAGGTLIQETVFEHVVRQDITQVTRDVLNEHLAHIVGNGKVVDYPNGQIHHFNHEAWVSASEAASALASVQSAVRADVWSIPGRTWQYNESSSFSSATVWLQPTVTTTNNGSTFEFQTSVDVTQTDDAVIIGDPNGDPSSWTVTQGTVTVTTTETTIETQHITETTENNYNIVDTYGFNACRTISPIVLDLDGAGLEATGGEWLPRKEIDKTRMAFFDLNGNGFPVLMEWVGPNDGLLVKPMADGRIDGTCLFGTVTGFESGYEALTVEDVNNDGVVSGDELADLSVWQDANSNAYPDQGEVKSVSQLGITSLSLKHDKFKSTYSMRGQDYNMYDWWPNALELRRFNKARVVSR